MTYPKQTFAEWLKHHGCTRRELWLLQNSYGACLGWDNELHLAAKEAWEKAPDNPCGCDERLRITCQKHVGEMFGEPEQKPTNEEPKYAYWYEHNALSDLVHAIANKQKALEEEGKEWRGALLDLIERRVLEYRGEDIRLFSKKDIADLRSRFL